MIGLGKFDLSFGVTCPSAAGNRIWPVSPRSSQGLVNPVRWRIAGSASSFIEERIVLPYKLIHRRALLIISSGGFT